MAVLVLAANGFVGGIEYKDPFMDGSKSGVILSILPARDVRSCDGTILKLSPVAMYRLPEESNSIWPALWLLAAGIPPIISCSPMPAFAIIFPDRSVVA